MRLTSITLNITLRMRLRARMEALGTIISCSDYFSHGLSNASNKNKLSSLLLIMFHPKFLSTFDQPIPASRDFGFGLGIWIGDWDWGLGSGIGIGDRDWGLAFEI